MLGTYVNVAAIIIGSLIGLLFRTRLKANYTKTIQEAMALAVIAIGAMSAIKMTEPLLILISLLVGAIIGEFIGLDRMLNNFAKKLETRFTDGNFSKGFVTATLVYCVGAMAIYGSIEAGLNGNYSTLFVKSTLDGITSIIFASTFGIGVLLSAVPVFLYQGTITILSSILANNIPEIAIINMTAIGGILLIGIALNILNITKIRLTNLIPALFIPLIYYLLF